MGEDRTGAGGIEPACRWCAEAHPETQCPRVKAFGLDAEGNIIRVEFMMPADYRGGRVAMDEPATSEYPTLGEGEGK